MDDASRKRPGKTFEPPPWEREQFEELARTRDPGSPETPGADASEAQAAVEELIKPAAASTEQKAPAKVEPAAADAEDERLKEAKMTAMLAQLRVEEPAKDPTLWKVGLAFSGLSAVAGAILVVWGLAAMFSTGNSAAGMIGGAVLLSFGGLFAGVGVWMAVRSLKERGVL